MAACFCLYEGTQGNKPVTAAPQFDDDPLQGIRVEG